MACLRRRTVDRIPPLRWSSAVLVRWSSAVLVNSWQKRLQHVCGDTTVSFPPRPRVAQDPLALLGSQGCTREVLALRSRCRASYVGSGMIFLFLLPCFIICSVSGRRNATIPPVATTPSRCLVVERESGRRAWKTYLSCSLTRTAATPDQIHTSSCKQMDRMRREMREFDDIDGLRDEAAQTKVRTAIGTPHVAR